jgi:hypothetical protein
MYFSFVPTALDLDCFHVWSPHRLSDSEDDPAEGAAINQVTYGIRCFRQREHLGHDGLDRTGME